MGLGNTVRDWLWGWLSQGELYDAGWRERVSRYQTYREYVDGVQRRQLKTNPVNNVDDNLTENFLSLVVERSVSMLVGAGVTFELPTDAEQELINDTLESNDFESLIHDAAENAAVAGTGYIKFLPQGVESMTGEDVMRTRLIVLDPRWMQIITPPDDIGKTIGYEMRYMVGDTAVREIIDVASYGAFGQPANWQITTFTAKQMGRWEQTGPPVLWDYEFPPTLHWKNLPQANDCYGLSDIAGAVELQDRINFVAGNISKVIRYHAHPKTWGRGAGIGSKASWGADEIVMLSGDNSLLQNLEMQSDLASSRAFYNDLKAALFDITRTVDLSSMRDRVGQLTNFGLRVLYQDALAKNETKRRLFGRGLLEMVHRLLILEGRPGDPGEIVWGDPLPVNDAEINAAHEFDLANGLASKETIATRRGYDWEQESERLDAEGQTNTNLGAALLAAFDRGEGAQ